MYLPQITTLNTRVNLIWEHDARNNTVATTHVVRLLSAFGFYYSRMMELVAPTFVIYAGVVHASFVDSAPELFDS